MSRRWLERWFGDRRTEQVLAMVREHLELTQKAVEELYIMVQSASEARQEKEALYKKISEIEMKADHLRRDMVDELTKREIFPNEREDLMELVRAVDWIADWSREAGRILVIIPFESSPEEMKSSVIEMCKACVACVTNLARCIRVLPDNPKEAIELANEVEMLEEDIDDLYSITRHHLANLEFTEFSLGALILLNEFLDSIETVADWCENSADIVRAIAVRIH
jgi:predicted phosphate transport protein (TIGR00153 family)